MTGTDNRSAQKEPAETADLFSLAFTAEKSNLTPDDCLVSHRQDSLVCAGAGIPGKEKDEKLYLQKNNLCV